MVVVMAFEANLIITNPTQTKLPESLPPYAVLYWAASVGLVGRGESVGPGASLKARLSRCQVVLVASASTSCIHQGGVKRTDPWV